MEKNDIEQINKMRLELYNSPEYNLGKKIIKAKRLIKKGKIIDLLKITFRSKKIKELSVKENVSYSQLNKNKEKYETKKIVVYTCITGSYDELLEPMFVADNIDYVLFTDNDKMIAKKNTLWKIKLLSDKELDKLSLSGKNRFVKMHPYYFFEGKYDYAIYIDGNVQVVSDIRKLVNAIDDKLGMAMHLHRNRDDIYSEYKVCNLLKKGNKEYLVKQISRYKEKEFPPKYGMLEANVFIVDLNNKKSKDIFSQWWDEFFASKSGRDQISLPYILWKNGIKLNDVASLGSDVYSNPIFCINLHRRDEEL